MTDCLASRQVLEGIPMGWLVKVETVSGKRERISPIRR
jgi:hypothetical protein